MAFFGSTLRGKGRTLQNVLLRFSKPASGLQGLAPSPSESLDRSATRAFSSLVPKWGMPTGKSSHTQGLQSLSLHHPLSAHLYQQSPEAFSAQQVRLVYVEVIDNDIDGALKVYKRKLANSGVEEKLSEKRFYVKPCERRKLAKHYKKLNRARRVLNEKLDTVRYQMEKVREVRKLDKQERKRVKAAEMAAEAEAAAEAAAKSSESTG
ncbi:hypothetical protein L7F22_023400 [Adiantum nelumboides]|nr:hypothetical protein [Adiantum nelumboides]